MFEKSYLIKAFYQWASDFNYTIEMLSWFKHASYNNQIPEKYLNVDEEDGLLLNISRNAIKDLEIGKEKIEFSVSFEDNVYPVSIDIEGVYWLKAKEIDEYLMLDNDPPYVRGCVQNIQEEAKYIEEIKNKRIGMSPEEIQKWIQENVNKYTAMLHINDWRIRYKIIKYDDPISIKNQALHTNEGGRSGDCSTLYQYRSATIRLFAAQIPNVESLKRLVIHELAHVAMACFDLYTKFFEKRAIYLDSEKEIAKRIAKDVHELLAVKIETIIAGQQNDTIGIYEKADEADERFRRDCQEASILSKPKIVLDKKIVPTNPFEIVEEAKKHDPDYWYSRCKQAMDLSYEKYKNNQTPKDREKIQKQFELERHQKEKKIILPIDHKEKLEKKDSLEEGNRKKIIIPNITRDDSDHD